LGGGNGRGKNSSDVSGKVIDEYTEGAHVYLDLNNNGKLENGEPNDTSDPNGDCTLYLTAEQEKCASHVSLIADVPVGAIIIKDDGSKVTIDAAFQLASPPTYDAGASLKGRHFTAITTVEYDQLASLYSCKDGPLDFYGEKKKLNTVEEKVAKELGFADKDIDLYADYVKTSDGYVQDVAHEVVEVKQQEEIVKDGLKNDDILSIKIVTKKIEGSDNWERRITSKYLGYSLVDEQTASTYNANKGDWMDKSTTKTTITGAGNQKDGELTKWTTWTEDGTCSRSDSFYIQNDDPLTYYIAEARYTYNPNSNTTKDYCLYSAETDADFTDRKVPELEIQYSPEKSDVNVVGLLNTKYEGYVAV